MADRDRERRLSLIAQVDERLIARSRQRVRELREEFQRLELAERDIGQAGVRSARDLSQLDAETRRSVRGVRERIRALDDELDLYIQQARAIDDLTAAERARTREIEVSRQARIDVQRATTGITQAGYAAGTIAARLGQAGLAGPAGAVGAAGDVLQLASAVPRLTAALKDAPQAVEAMVGPLIGVEASFGAVAAAAAPVAIAIGAVGIAFIQFQKQLEEQKVRLEAAIDAQQLYYETIAEGTSDEIRAAIQQREVQRDVAQALIADLENARRVALEAYGLPESTGEGFIIERFPGIAQLTERITEVEDEAKSAQAEIDALNEALNSTTILSREAAAARREADEARIADIERMADREIEAYRLIDTASSEAVEAQVAAIERQIEGRQGEIEALQLMAIRSQAARERIGDLHEEMNDLEAQTRLLTETVIPLIRAREREAAALERRRDALEDTEERLEQTRERQEAYADALSDFNADMADLEAKIAERRRAILERTGEAIANIQRRLADTERDVARGLLRADEKAARELADARLDLERELGEEQEEVRRESNDRLADLERRHMRDLERIYRDFNRTAADAIRDRDADALAAAEERRDDELAEAEQGLEDAVDQEKRAARERVKAARDANRDRLRDLEESFRRERRERLIAAQYRLNDAREAALAEIALQQEKEAANLAELQRQAEDERRLRTQQFRDELTALGGHIRNIGQLNEEGLTALAEQQESYWQAQERAAILRLSRLNDIIYQAETGVRRGSGPYEGFQAGGEVTRRGLAMLHGSRARPEYVLSADTNAALRRELGGRFTQAQLVRAVRGVSVNNSGMFGPGAIVAGPGMDERALAAEIARQVGQQMERRLPSALTRIINRL